jgi:hypothetical protein
MPIIPYIGDSFENIRRIASLCKEHHAEFVLFSGMTLKSGRQKTHFLGKVEKHFPNKLNDIIKCYSNNNKYGVPREDVSMNPSIIGPCICEEVGINWLSIRHGCPDEYKSNTLVLKKLLESIYMDSWLLRTPQRIWKPYFDLVVKLERGLPEISDVLKSENTSKRFHISDKLRYELFDILKNGSSERIDCIKNRVLALALSRAKFFKT